MIKVVSNSLESIMRLLLNSEDNISWDHIRDLFSLFLKNYFITILHSFLNHDIQLFNITNNFLSSTMLAISLVYISSTMACITLDLHLHLHSKSHLNSLHNHSLSITFWTLFCLAILCTGTSTFRAIYISSN